MQKIVLPVDEIVRLYVEEKQSTVQIANRFKVDRGTISNRLKEKGIKPRQRFDVSTDELVRLYVEEKNSIKQISQKVKMHPSSVNRRLKKRGIKTKFFLTEQTKKKLVKLYQDKHLSAGQIAQQLGSSTDTVLLNLKKVGVNVRKPYNLKVPLAEIVRLYNQKQWPATRIAKKVGVSRKTITRRLRQAGVDIRQTAPRKTLSMPDDEIARLYVQENKTAYEIGDLLGVHSVTILDRLREVGVKIRPVGATSSGPNLRGE